MSGSDPSGFSWLDKVFGDSSGWEAAAAFGGFGTIVTSGAYLAYLGQGGSISLSGFAGSSGLGGGVAIGEAFAGLNDPGANASYARPTGELSQGALYYEGAGAAPPRAGGAVACMPGCLPDPRSAFPTEEAYQAWLDGVLISANVIGGAASLGRWLLARATVRVIPANIHEILTGGSKLHAFARTLNTSKGAFQLTVDDAADVIISGRTLALNEAGFFHTSGKVVNVGAAEIRAALRPMARELHGLGFDKVIIRGERIGKQAGHLAEYVLDLAKF